MRATIWGCRGSLATPGAPTVRYGGNTSSVEVRPSSGRVVILDAGTGIRSLGLSLGDRPEHIDILLTHLHLDHVEGLGFFAPFFDERTTITIWGPPQEGSSLTERIAGYLSPPFFPLAFDTLPAQIEFVEVRDETWRLDGLTVTASTVCHPGTTLGYRLEEDDRSIAFIPDNELGLDRASGLALAAGADVLFHDAQYTAEEYATRSGWGHSSLDDFAAFVRETDPGEAVMFHHDPSHSDAALEEMKARAQELSGRDIALAAEGLVVRPES